ncbi:Importin alpha subunit (Karyopherin alpha subunit) (Serine-rich RNA polymerase I suppressor protein), partial [Tulasnella sp. 408]
MSCNFFVYLTGIKSLESTFNFPGLLVTIPRDRLLGGFSNISPQLLFFPKTWPESAAMSEEPISDAAKSLADLKLGEGTATDGVPEDFTYEPTPSELDGLITEDGMIIPQVVDDLTSESPVVRLRALIRIQRRLQDTTVNPTVQAIIDSNLVQVIVDFLTHNDVRFQERAARAAANIAAGTSEQTEAAVAAGAIQKIMKLHPFSSAVLQRGALYALGNIAADSGHLRDRVLREKGMEPVLEVLTKLDDNVHEESIVAPATRALSAYLKRWHPGRYFPSEFIHIQQCVLILAKLIRSRQSATSGDSSETLENSVISLSRICEKGHLAEVLETGILPQLVSLCNSSNPIVQRFSLRSLGFFAADTEALTDAVINAGLLPNLITCITSENKNTRELACWTASNVVAGTAKQAQAIVNMGVIQPVVNLLSDSTEDMLVRKEACWVLTNLVVACIKHPAQDWSESLYEEEFIMALCKALVIEDNLIRRNA